MRSKTRQMFCLLLIFSVSGCAGPERFSLKTQAIRLPDKWDQHSSVVNSKIRELDLQVDKPVTGLSITLPSTGWLESFGDSQLVELFSIALQNSTEIKLAELKVETAQLDEKGSVAQLWPNIGLEFGALRERQLSNSGSHSRGTSREFSAMLTTSWELDLWGENRYASRAANLSVLQNQHLVAAARLSVSGVVSKTWFNLLAVEKQRQILAGRLASLTKSEVSTARHVSRGLKRPLDLELTRAERYQAEASLQNTIEQLGLAQNQLLGLLHQLEPMDFDIDVPLPTLIGNWQLELPVNQLLSRPDVQAAYVRIQQADALADSAHRARFPGLTLVANVGRSAPQLRDLDNQLYDISSIALNALFPLFNAGALKAAQERQENQAEAALVAFKEKLIKAFFEVESALLAERTVRMELRSLESGLQAAKKASQSANRAYSRGLIDVLAYLDIQRNEFDIAVQQIALQNKLLDNRVDLHLALGGAPTWPRAQQVKLPGSE